MILLNILRFFGFKRGCLHGKTQEQKEEFFFLLQKMASVDKEFFRKQCMDFLPSELTEFEIYLKEKEKALKYINSGLELAIKLIS